MLLRKNRRLFKGRSRQYSSVCKLQICSRGAMCNFRPVFLVVLLQWPIIRHFCVLGPLCIKSKIGYRGSTFLQFMSFIPSESSTTRCHQVVELLVFLRGSYIQKAHTTKFGHPTKFGRASKDISEADEQSLLYPCISTSITNLLPYL